ncbi:MAG: hypothetical protein PVG24_03770 [Gammaproteobacteria bacterium]|jgi:hypothetical protein
MKPLRTAWLLAVSLAASPPATAQMDFSGEWPVVRAQDNTDNPHLGEYVGLPLTREAIRRAEIWDASIQSLPEWQCRPHSGAYIKRGPSNLRIWKEVDPASREIVAFQTEWLRSTNTPIYMDGRDHPPAYAAHTWGGFQTGRFEGDRLRIRTTHLKEDYYRRNGVPQSDEATLSEFLIRRRFGNEDYLTWLIIAYDPVYLTEPLVRSTEYRLDVNQRIPPYPCTIVTEVVVPDGYVPHYLPGTNNQIYSFSDTYALPRSLHFDGAETMYPEYRFKLARELGIEIP